MQAWPLKVELDAIWWVNFHALFCTARTCARLREVQCPVCVLMCSILQRTLTHQAHVLVNCLLLSICFHSSDMSGKRGARTAVHSDHHQYQTLVQLCEMHDFLIAYPTGTQRPAACMHALRAATGTTNRHLSTLIFTASHRPERRHSISSSRESHGSLQPSSVQA